MSAPLRVVIAPDKFKGSLSARQAAEAIARGLRAASERFDPAIVPMADGGDGTVDAIIASGGWTPVDTFAMRDDEAVVEMASSSGLALTQPDARDALRATSYGTGEVMRAALDRGARKIVVGVGGSASTDGGAGALEALGARFYDDAGEPLERGGAALLRLERIDLSGLDPRLRTADLAFATDVDNPLLGPRGASAVFAPQKGASAAGVALLDAALARFADVLEANAHVARARSDPGTGAGGGMPFALRALLGARIESGFTLIARAVRLQERLAGARYCFTGEGSIDAQTFSGKVVAGVCELAREADVPVVAFGGRVDADARRRLALQGCEAIAIAEPAMPLERAMRDAAALLEAAARTSAAGRVP